MVPPVGEVEVGAVSLEELGGTIVICGKSDQGIIAGRGVLFDIEGPSTLRIAVSVETGEGAGGVLICDDGGIKLEIHPGDGLAVLIHLLDPLIEQRLEVEAQGQAGVVVAPLQIEHFQGVGGIAGESAFLPLGHVLLAGTFI